jgi:SAM-dependent methyltransferase
MERELYQQMAASEDKHWWFAARRSMVRALLSKTARLADANLLDAGCGTGGNLAMLSEFGNVYGFEYDDEARGHAAKRGIGTIAAGRLPDGIPFDDKLFDGILLTDVLEHIDDDDATLATLSTRLKQGGWLVITVPAFSFLWTRHDVQNHHKRRYRKAELESKLKQAGFDLTYSGYCFMTIFPLALLSAWFEKLGIAGLRETGLKQPRPLINMTLRIIASLDAAFIRLGLRLPFGVSCIVLAKKI